MGGIEGIMGPLVAGAGSAAGGALGNAVSGNGDALQQALQGNNNYVNGVITSMNNILTNSLSGAVNTSTNYTGQAIDAQGNYLNNATGALNTSLNNSTSALNTSLQNALSQSQAQATQGFNTSQALNSPYSNAGMNALNMYEDSLGVARPAAGNQALVQSQLNNQNGLQPLIAALKSSGSAYGATDPFSTPTAPTAPAAFSFSGPQQIPGNPANSQALNTLFSLSQQSAQGTNINPGSGDQASAITSIASQLMNMPQSKLNSAQKQFLQQYTQAGGTAGETGGALLQSVVGNQANPAYTAAQQAYQTAMNQYNQQQGLFNQYNSAYGNLSQYLGSNDPNAIKMGLAASQGLFGTPQQVNVGTGGTPLSYTGALNQYSANNLTPQQAQQLAGQGGSNQFGL